MIYKLCAVRDAKALLFWQPQLHPNEEAAKRDFAMMVNSSDVRTQVGFAPGDFDLYLLGTFDTESGQIVPVAVPEYLCNGRAMLEVKNAE